MFVEQIFVLIELVAVGENQEQELLKRYYLVVLSEEVLFVEFHGQQAQWLIALTRCQRLEVYFVLQFQGDYF